MRNLRTLLVVVAEYNGTKSTVVERGPPWQSLKTLNPWTQQLDVSVFEGSIIRGRLATTME